MRGGGGLENNLLQPCEPVRSCGHGRFSRARPSVPERRRRAHLWRNDSTYAQGRPYGLRVCVSASCGERRAMLTCGHVRDPWPCANEVLNSANRSSQVSHIYDLTEFCRQWRAQGCDKGRVLTVIFGGTTAQGPSLIRTVAAERESEGNESREEYMESP